MFVHNIDPVLVRVFGLEIRYYGIIYALGFLFGLWYCLRVIDRGQLKLTKDDAHEFFFYFIIAVVAGARLFEVFVYQPGYYFSHPAEILAVWHGGLSFHGGLLGGILAIYWYAKKKGLSFYDMSDILVIPAALGLAFGRIANFINGEVVGTITNVPWAVKFPMYDGFRHPAQLYESMAHFVLFGILLVLRGKNLGKGMLTWLYLGGYSFFRVIIEFWKEPESFYFGIPTGQMLSIMLLLVSVFMIYRIRRLK